MRTDPHYVPFATEEVVARNRRLIGVLVALSLAMCFGRKTQQFREQIPTATSTKTLTFTVRDDDLTTLMVEPWSFRRQLVTLVNVGRYLTETYSAEEMMHQSLSHAPVVTSLDY